MYNKKSPLPNKKDADLLKASTGKGSALSFEEGLG